MGNIIELSNGKKGNSIELSFEHSSDGGKGRKE